MIPTLRSRICRLPRLKFIILGVCPLNQSNIPRRNILQNVWDRQRARRCLSSGTQPHISAESPHTIPPFLDPSLLPVSCPGCGALAQWVYPNEAGFYNTSRRLVKQYTRHRSAVRIDSGSTVDIPVENAGPQPVNVAAKSRSEEQSQLQPEEAESSVPQIPFCDRCHNLINHGYAAPIPCPSISYIRDIITESPFKYNHVYHILDAADFPMSLIPNIHRDLSLQPQRSRNRRSCTKEYDSRGRRPVLSFVIARSDLLAPVKEKVDSVMSYIVEVLRTALSSTGTRIRLGNVHMVSAHRGWWTKDLKQKIWEHGGGVWMVGKMNVGKSSLVTAVFPKSGSEAGKLRGVGREMKQVQRDRPKKNTKHSEQQPNEGDKDNDRDSLEATYPSIGLLPPVQPQTPFPVLPIASPRPGTTASPIRIPFGDQKGELIDLPGLARDGLQDFVKNEHKLDLIMTKRPKPERLIIKQGQSLLLGGLIRITPVDAQDVLLAAPFVPLKSHVTSTEKAMLMQTQRRASPGLSIAKDDIGDVISSAGTFDLKWDVTKTYSGPWISKSLPLPFQVMSADILIEGCGWVEVTTQIRTKDKASISENFPKVEIFSPKGGYISSRMPMSAWAFLLEKQQKASKKLKPRPRRRMKGVEKPSLHN